MDQNDWLLTKSHSTSVGCSVQSVMEEIERVVAEKNAFEYFEYWCFY